MRLIPRFAIERVTTAAPGSPVFDARGWVLAIGWLGLVVEIAIARVGRI